VKEGGKTGETPRKEASTGHGEFFVLRVVRRGAKKTAGRLLESRTTCVTGRKEGQTPSKQGLNWGGPKVRSERKRNQKTQNSSGEL